MYFRRFRSRLVVVFLGLFALIQVTGYLAVAAFVRASARQHVEEELRLAGAFFARQLDDRARQLVTATRLLSGDFALKTAAATADHATTASMLENHRLRAGADRLMLASLDGRIVADTGSPERLGTPFPAPRLIAEAEAGRESLDVVTIDGRLYRLTVVPLLAPEPIAWLGAGYAIGDRTAADLRLISGLHVSFVLRDGTRTSVHASTLAAPSRQLLAQQLPAIGTAGAIQINDHEHLVHVQPVGQNVAVVLQRPLDEALAPYDRLLLMLLLVAVAGVLLALLGAALVARRVSRPVLALAEGARRVAAGDFTTAVSVGQRDELGELATRFNEMVGGLREHERVRDELDRTARLKRYFSPQVADALSGGDEALLGSHRREITVVFCDLRGFTAFAEAVEADELMRMLRDYHAAIGPLVFRHEGTLERFIGDGLVVFFNDPLPCPDPAARAVEMAVAMRDAVAPLLAAWRDAGHALGFGAGIAKGYATVGRVGFEGRFDYAAIGSVSNLASRLCQEARDGQIIVSQHVFADVAPLVDAKPVGPLTLRGFAQPVPAYNVTGLKVRRSRVLAVGVAALALALVTHAVAVAGSLEVLVKDERGKRVTDAVVTLTPAGGAPPAPRPIAAVMDQQHRMFVPLVLAVPVGTAVHFPNRDAIRHHVYSFSPAKRFELPLYMGLPASPVVFDKPGVVVLGCNIHDWMVSYIYVSATPYFARTAADGVVRLADVPAGAYEARVWHPRLRTDPERTMQPVAIAERDASRAEFVIDLKPERRILPPPPGYTPQS